jgi:hypothetical protein
VTGSSSASITGMGSSPASDVRPWTVAVGRERRLANERGDVRRRRWWMEVRLVA